MTRHVFSVRSSYCFRCCRVIVGGTVFSDLLQMGFKMLNSQSANITFHLKQKRQYIHSFFRERVCFPISFSVSFEISIR